MMFQRVAIIGVGLIGGSLGGAIKERKLAESVVGCGRTAANLETAVQRGLIDTYTTYYSEAVKDADLVVLATPVTYYPHVVKEMQTFLKQGTIVTDVGSVKSRVIKEVVPLLPDDVDFVPAHPVAGTEKSGAAHAFSTLFEGRKCVITPCEKTRDGLEKVKALWEAVGMSVEIMSPEVHDEVMAFVSHLPHMAAYALVDCVGSLDSDAKPLLRFSAGGFRDFTRVASSPEEMWSDICLWNAERIVQAIDVFSRHLGRLRELVQNSDREGLLDFFRNARLVREEVLKKNG